jgi:hypothetical protein
MPCTYTGSIDGDRLLAVQERAQSREESLMAAVNMAKGELDIRERMLCAICTEAEREYGKDSLRVFLESAALSADGLNQMEIVEWWESHKAAEGRDSHV